MVNPGSFQGKRKEFLLGEKAAYAAAVEGDYAADAIANIQRRFFKRFPIEMPADEEPTLEFLDAVNDEEADKDPELPRESEMTPEEFAAAMKALEQRAEMIAFRKGQIKRWLVYQHMKDNSVDDPSRDGAYRALLQRLTGVGDSRPWQKTASNVWRRDRRDVIEAEARRRVPPQDKKKLASIRQMVASEMFAALSAEEKEKWDKIAKTEHTFAVDKWENEINGPPSTRPVDRQKCILGLVTFIQPILDGVAAATGWKCSLIAGGPEPASGGRLTIVSAHAGVTSGDIKMNFVRAERQKYKDGVLPAFASFLRKCYIVLMISVSCLTSSTAPDDCRAFALSPNSNIRGMDVIELEKEGSTDAPQPAPPPQEPLPVNIMTHNALTYPPPSAHVMSFLSALSLNRSKSFAAAPANTSTSMLAMSSSTSHRSTSPSCESITSSDSSESTSSSTSTSSSSSTPATSTTSLSDGEDAGPEASDCEDVAARRTRSRASKSRSEPAQRKSRATSKRRQGVPAVQDDSSVARRSKRQRIGETMAPPPDWFTKVWEGFTSEDLGEKWTKFLGLWKAFEQREGFKDGAKLGSRNRPAIVEEWIAHRHRSTIWRPAIDLKDFESNFKAWWTALQPEWRVSRGSIKKSQLDGEWGPLRRSGKNGFLSIVAALFYWGINAQESAKSRKAWLTALSDCTSALERL
ncbi:hypothetical protein CVT26_008766 [Gymnopilus dilepis]|uniref:Uncharacterized protein n=1 Tax=Gymnopilus dilepis TaxID=231916 RepID=A0A409X2E7_9AGAR|nr:hypothetical protein CVT26_008766 [Gymnopilus dilepis]